MIKIGITQRVSSCSNYNERRDCLDQRWPIFLQRLGMLAVPIPNSLPNPDVFFDIIGFNGFILSGGNDLSTIKDGIDPSKERDATEYKLLDYAFKNQKPVLGICRGLQLINEYLGGTLNHIEGHIATRHQIKIEKNDRISLNGFERIEVNSYHSYGITEKDMAEGLNKLAIADDGTIEAVYHHNLPWFGIMWHPERENIADSHDLLLFNRLFQLKY